MIGLKNSENSPTNSPNLIHIIAEKQNLFSHLQNWNNEIFFLKKLLQFYRNSFHLVFCH